MNFMTTTVPRGQARETRALIGCNLRPGMVRGGFSTMFRGNSKDPDARRDRLRLGEANKAIKEAAEDMLLGRQMPRAEEAQP